MGVVVLYLFVEFKTLLWTGVDANPGPTRAHPG